MNWGGVNRDRKDLNEWIKDKLNWRFNNRKGFKVWGKDNCRR